LLGMTKRDLTVKNACLIYKYLLALTDWTHHYVQLELFALVK
jgi:hypothetical protein